MKRAWLIGLGGLGLMILAGMVVVGLTGQRDAVEQFDATGKLWAIRGSVYLLVVAFWYFVAPRKIAPKHQEQSDSEKEEAESKRNTVRAMTWKVALFIVIFEAVAVQQLGLS